MKYEIKKIDWLRAGMFSGIFYGVLGGVPLVFGIVAFWGSSISSGNFNAEFWGFLLFPLGFFVGGFVVGAVFAVIYNSVAERWGGLRMEIEYHEK